MARVVDWDKKKTKAFDEIERFKPSYIGVSWGKDSLVIAHLCWELSLQGWECPPLVFIRVIPRFNPEVDLVRDAFLADCPLEYHEVEVQFTPQPDGTWTNPGGKLTSSAGFNEAARRFGPRYVSGIRAEESSDRKERVKRGLSTKNTCAPIGHWSTVEVFAYLRRYDLPIHPAYAYLGGTRWERDRLRVSSLFGNRGTGHGRREWEMQYYGDRYHELREEAINACSR